MRMFSLRYSHEFVLYSKATLLIKNMSISRLVVYRKQVEEEKKNKLIFMIGKARGLGFLTEV